MIFSAQRDSSYDPGSPLCSIDCAGILKLRNADIELRKGETDIGRKNTRVRLVFRVHVPEPSGRIISLQAASNPIECCKSDLGTGGPHECPPWAGGLQESRDLRRHTVGLW